MNSSDLIWSKALLPINSTIAHAIRSLNEAAVKIVMITNENGGLEGTISDGDIRRGLIKGLTLNSPVANIMHRNALVVPPDLERKLVMQIMVANKIQQIPVVNEQYQVIGLHVWNEISTPPMRPNLMVIMAGGKGKRLRPHTNDCPKPLLPIAGKPMLCHIIERAKAEGFSDFVISINYLGHMIEEYFGDGGRFDIRISYLREDMPLGTAGSLGLLNPIPNAPFVVTNGDVVTDIRYGELLDFHTRNSAIASMAVRLHEWQHPYGVVQTDGIEIIGFEEKPISVSHINAGVYALDPAALGILISGVRCDMPTLFDRLRVENHRIVAYPMHEPWLDVGRPIDLQIANTATGHD